MTIQGRRLLMANSAGNLVLLKNESKRFFKFFLSELKPKGKLITPFNIISALIIIVGVVLIVIRFAKGLGSVTNLNQEFPWGITKASCPHSRSFRNSTSGVAARSMQSRGSFLT